jgi:xanthine dehydrogenase YagT iron-sulfur-binding subunit
VQQVFLDHFSFQCGYCTPGFVNAATVLLERLQRQPVPREKLEETVAAALESISAAVRVMYAISRPSGI